jgi:hypothetical protein
MENQEANSTQQYQKAYALKEEILPIIGEKVI